MAIGKARFQIRGLNEERQFTNPHVRFIRRGGKIIPIINRKRIGQDISSAGGSITEAGAIAGGVGLLKKTKIIKKASNLVSKVPSFTFQPNFLKLNKSSTFKKKAAVKSFRAINAGIKFVARNIGKIGALGFAAGIATKLAGDELQARSAFGKDFFFTKDRQGRDS